MYDRVTEASYLTADNAWRYRSILRYFFIEHERMREFLFPEEIYQHLMQFEDFNHYTMEMLHLDLDALVKWGNLVARQELGKSRTIEEFKKKRFRYQCTPYTVEFERMLMSIEDTGESFGGSLERTQFERLYESVEKINQIISGKRVENDEECAQIWEDVLSYFRQITKNTSDYFAYINSEEVEERMQTEAFLIYKDQFTTYLRDFIIALQATAIQIQDLLRQIKREERRKFFDQVMNHSQQVFRFSHDDQVNQYEDYEGKWSSIKTWFLGDDQRESEYDLLQERTNESIRRITRVVQRLGERHQHYRSRREDYLYLARWFDSLDTLEEAHQLSSVVFGVFHTRHFYIDQIPSDDIYSDVWDEQPMEHETKPIVRHYREKTRAGAIVDRAEVKEEMAQAHLKERRQEQELIEKYIHDRKIKIANLPVVEPPVRKVLLLWLGKAIGKEDRVIKTELGRQVKLVNEEGRVLLRAEDGDLEMPNVTFEFLEEGESSL
ncbi:TIGR02677 family protein [Amphibacillus sp. MSJ-3]|uniref:TIGR02677 family protein n=1 Tax=Amphibacillus sp. MSJ-3 TaxID=2841505 RepID=UPI001C0EDBCB|nr:TIGR02677 family protein [Amphibacillus sp. MSJ-3]MBU5594330.1 TIGR02677 family protein [Amphibacillus sp. MSJ-3]